LHRLRNVLVLAYRQLCAWLKCPERKSYTRTKFRKIDPTLLLADVEAYPDAYQSERAARLGVHQSTIFYLLKKLNIIAKSINFDLILWIDFGYMTLFLRETGRENRYPLFAGFAITPLFTKEMTFRRPFKTMDTHSSSCHPTLQTSTQSNTNGRRPKLSEDES
jgi:hypothetical protein